jgi:cellulose 1,4-beta-cellobiosidase
VATAFACAAALLTGLSAPANAHTTARVDNPYVGATPYVNPEWSAHAAAEPGGAAVSAEPTAVWLDSIASLQGTGGAMGLRAHLDAALAQGADLVQLVLYDLPGRDCQRLQSGGELGPTELDRYRFEFIDPIAAITGASKYAALRIVTIIEPNSLENLVLYTGDRPGALDTCQVMKDNGTQVNAIGYALASLGGLPNVYPYMDASYNAKIGWPEDAQATVEMLHTAATANGATVQDVAGFITNTADYGVLQEPYFKVTDKVNGVSVAESRWVNFNPFIDELPFAAELRQRAVAAGFGSGTGMLIDTSRNGWGGSHRPTGPGPMTTVDAYVDGSRLDRRTTVGAWCNQDGAGLGERPVAAPASGIDAYVWAKAPGVSDGPVYTPGGGFGSECDPTEYTGWPRDRMHPLTGALPGSPEYGQWFSAQFRQLLANAYPPV